MPNDQFERIMRFAAKTGDRLIVTDPAGTEPLVIMSLDEYEALVEGALGPGDFDTHGAAHREDHATGDEDEYGEAPTLEIIERMPEEHPVPPAAHGAPRGVPVPPQARQEEQKVQEKRQDPSEEQFYLEPL